MAELRPAPFRDLVTRLLTEPATQDTLFELPRRKWYRPAADGPDLSVRAHGRRAGNPLGPAAGPHTQMAQNILLSYVAGGRMLELKTVQVDDRLTIPRPCIDMTNIGLNVEWSQELRIEDALREYVAGAMLIEMFRRQPELGGETLAGPAEDVLFDVSVGYDLEGMRSDKVRRFLEGVRDTSAMVEWLRTEMPRELGAAREAAYPTRLAHSATLSTFHGCPAEEIERICELLIGEHDFDVIVKMNPPLLGRERLEHLLHEVLGYAELQVSPAAYESGWSLEEAAEACARLRRLAAQRGRQVGFKFSNTLEVEHRGGVFGPDCKVMYLSGQPLHVITMTLVDEFRRRVGPEVPISFSAGIDRRNFPLAVACGFVPVTVATDLLRPGGYGRLSQYLAELVKEMAACGAGTVDEFVLRRFDQAAEARRRVRNGKDEAAAVRWAGLLNTSIVGQMAREEPRYRAAKNRYRPRKVGARLATFDCVTCNKCVAVCPNAAMFRFATPPVAFDYHDVIVSPSGDWRDGRRRRFEITQEQQFACCADFCNECGNCDTFCPEEGGPFRAKPNVFGTMRSWQQAAPRDGVFIRRTGRGVFARGRLGGVRYQYATDEAQGRALFQDPVVAMVVSIRDHAVAGFGQYSGPPAEEHELDMGVYHTLRYLCAGVLDEKCVNQVSVVGRGR